MDKTTGQAAKTHPFIPGDRVRLKGKSVYAEIACLLPSGGVLVRWRNGRMDMVAPHLLTFNYGRRGK